MPRIAINGFGRIGRATFKAAWGNPKFDVVAINDLTDAKTLAQLLQYDSVYGKWKVPVRAKKNSLVVGNKTIPILCERDPQKLPWKKMKVAVVIESTGFFTRLEQASLHIVAGAKRVVISAPAKGEGVPTFVMATNDKDAKKSNAVINNASCTTNCVAPVTSIIEEAFGIQKALMTTIHAYTSTQNIVDGPNKDLRRARAAAINIIPTSTGAADATVETLPSLKDKFDGLSFRVPLPTVSLCDITYVLKKNVSVQKVHEVIKKAVKTPRFKGIVDYTEAPLVSSDFVGNPNSAIVDFGLTKVVGGNLLKVVAWYDNEWGYANRLAEMAIKIA